MFATQLVVKFKVTLTRRLKPPSITVSTPLSNMFQPRPRPIPTKVSGPLLEGLLRIGAVSADVGNRQRLTDSYLRKLVEKLQALNLAGEGFLEAIQNENKTM